MGGKAWTQSELDAVRQMYAEAPPLRSAELAKALGRSLNAVTLIGQRMGLGDQQRAKVSERKRRNVFTSPEELRAWQSEFRKAQQARDGHPRGALGLKHSPETRAKIAERVQKAYANPLSKLNDPKFLAERAAKSVAAIHAGPPRGGYSRAAGGRRADLDDRYFRSAWEANYARYLNLRMKTGELVAWEYETKTFVFERITRGTRSYTPDFKVIFKGGRIEWHEVKGWMDQKSATRLKRMTKYYPTEVVRIIDEKWFREAKRSGLTGIIAHWESQARGGRGC